MMNLAYWSFMMEQEKKNAPRGNRVYKAMNYFDMLCSTAPEWADVTDLFHQALRSNNVREFELTAADRERFQAIADTRRG